MASKKWYSARVSITVVEQGQKKIKTVKVVPDAWLDIRLPDGTHMPVVFELDRGSESKWKIQEKVQALLRYVQGPYKDLFDTPYATIAFGTPAGEHRRDMLLGYCEQALDEIQERRHADVFRFAALPAGETGPTRLALSPLWHRPFAFVGSGKQKAYTTPLPLVESS